MKSLNKDFWRSIARSFGRYLAIFLISGLGVGFLAGLQSVSPDMKDTADDYYNTYRLTDVRVQSTLGLTDEDVEALGALDFVSDIQPAKTLDVLVESDSGESAVHFMEIPKEGSLNGFRLVEGRLPENENECLADPGKLGSINPKVGDVITVAAGNDEDTLDALTVREFTVVGTALTPEYVSFERGSTTIGNGSIAYYVYVPEGVIDTEYYTLIDLTVSGAKELSSFSEEYESLIESAVDEVEVLAPVREQARYDEIIGDAQQELDDAQKELDDARAEAEAELADAQAQIDDARAELEDGEQELADGERELEDGWADYYQAEDEFEEQIASARQQLEDSAAELESGRAELTEQQAAFDENAAALEEQLAPLEEAKSQAAALAEQIESLTAAGQGGSAMALQAQLLALEEQIAAGEAQLAPAQEQLEAGRAQLEAAWQELEAGEAQLQAGQEELERQEREGRAQLNDARAQLEEAEQELEDGRAELEDGRKELEDAQAEYDEKSAEAQQEIDDAQKELDDAQKEIDDIEMAEWYVLDRDSLAGYASFANDTDRINNIAKVFPVFFFLVAALVCLTTMTRMVEEERTQIGTLKALGYSNVAVAAKYLLYAASATVLGSAVGLAVGFTVLPTVVWAAYGIMYNMPELILSFRWGSAALATAAALAVNLAATLSTCYREMKAMPAELMRPKAPKAGKRILLERVTPLWKRLNFIHKVTARNIFRYKKRFFMTVVGIAGCTALLLTGFGLKNSISGIVPLQFEELFLYDAMVVLPDGASEQTVTGVTGIVADSAMEYLPCHYESVDLTGPEGMVTDATLTVPKEAGRMSDFVTLRDRLSKAAVPLTDDGLLLSEKTAGILGVEEGDTLTISTGDRRVEATVSGVVENYVMHYLYLSPAVYESLYGSAPEYNSIYALLNDTSDAAEDALSERVLDEGALAVSFTSGIQEEFKDTMDSLDYVVIVLILAASLLCFVVLYNLTNINITERRREIATIKVLGFRDMEVTSYVYRENLVLTLLGIVFGLALGVGLHAFVMAAAEVDMVMFPREMSWVCYVIAAAMTLVFSMLVNLIMYRRLQKVDMVESLKSVE